MANRATRRRNRSKGVVVGGLTLAAMLASTRPLWPMTAYAAGPTYDWVRQNERIDLKDGVYNAVASSADGSVLLSAVAEGGDGNGEESPLYISRNNGTSWQNIAADLEEDIENYWVSVDVSNNGETMVAASANRWDDIENESLSGSIFVTENGGDSWADITPDDLSEGKVSHWQHIAVSGNGEKIVAVSNDDEENVYLTENAGDSWQRLQIDDEWSLRDWDTLVISDDGEKILVGGENSDMLRTQLYFTDNDGTSWENVTPDFDGTEYEIKAALDANGDKIVASVFGYSNSDDDWIAKVFMSENDGAAWTPIDPETGDSWNAVALSDDGKIAALGNADEGKVYFANTQDEDLDWSSVHPGTEFEDETINWFNIDLNADGSRFIGTGGEEVYTATIVNDEPQDEQPEVISFGNAEDSKAVVLTLPSGTTVTCHSAVKESGLSAQDAGYQYPVGLVDFCFDTEDESNAITLLFVTDLKPNQVVARKYNPNTKEYATVLGVSITETTHNGQHALRVAYTIVDNGPLDLDPDAGEISDPIGIASTVGAPNTGTRSIRDILFRW